jgi:glutaredoxin
MIVNIKSKIRDEVTLNPDNFCPQKTMDVKIDITYEGQHDGVSWTQKDVEEHENSLAREIMKRIKKDVEAFIKEVDPFACHVFKD